MKKNTRGPCRQLKTAKVTRVTNGRIPIGYDERHRAAPTAEQHSALAHDIGHVVRTFCPMRWKSWKAMPEETKNTMRNQLSISSVVFLTLFMLNLYIYIYYCLLLLMLSKYLLYCRQTTIWSTWTGTCSGMSIGSSPNATSSGRVTCTNVSSSLMIRRSLLRRDVRRSWRTDKIVGFGFAVIFRTRNMWCVFNDDFFHFTFFIF